MTNPESKSNNQIVFKKKIKQPNLISIKSRETRNKSKKPIVHVEENKSKPRIKLHLLTIKPRTRARIPSKLHVLIIKPTTTID